MAHPVHHRWIWRSGVGGEGVGEPRMGSAGSGFGATERESGMGSEETGIASDRARTRIPVHARTAASAARKSRALRCATP